MNVIMRARERLARTPLRLRLVAAVVALVMLALLVTASAGALALRSYLVDRIDDQLRATAHRVNVTAILQQKQNSILPSDYLVAAVSVGGANVNQYDYNVLRPTDLPSLPTTVKAVEQVIDKPFTARSSAGNNRWRVLITVRASGQIIVVAQQMTDVDQAIGRLVVLDLVIGGALLVVLAALGVALVRASLRPLVEIEHTAAAIAGGDLSRRVPEPAPETEVGRLAQALNAMLAQIEGAFAARARSEHAAREAARAAHHSESRAVRSEERMRQFIADASHELRTPLTTIRGFAELYRQGAVEPEQTAKLLRRIEDEAARMGLLVEDLLLLARLDEERPLALDPVDLRVLAGDAVVAARAVAPDRKITLEVPVEPDPLVVLGDESRLRQVAGNLMTNAITHTPADTPVTLRLARDGADALVEVIDTGPGLAADQVDHVFERFYRVDKARTRRAAVTGGDARHSGAGLGLAIVAGLVAAHNGRVEVLTEPGQGATFRVRLPLVDTAGTTSGTAAVPVSRGSLGFSGTSQADHSSAED
jgi:two-component system OmpR family sensor kinase